jgi:hypothetical protein
MRAAWFAAILAAFVAGAGAVLLTDSGPTGARVVVTAVGASSAIPGGTAINGQHVHGVVAGDVSAEAQPDVPLDDATRAQEAAQLVEARAVALRYPTVTDALKAGYHLAGGFAPGSGAHYVSYSEGGPGTVDVAHPGSLIYAGTSPDSKIIGLMYTGGGATAPEGFAGPNDHWHRHSNVCLRYTKTGIEVPFPADADVTLKQCSEAGGRLMPITTWMVHAWVVPGWESPEGVYSHNNSNIRCADGTYNTDKAGFCKGT